MPELWTQCSASLRLYFFLCVCGLWCTAMLLYFEYLRGFWSPRLVLVSCALSLPWWVTPTLQYGSRSRYCYGVGMHAHAALWIWWWLVKGLCTAGCAVRGVEAWLCLVQRVLLARWRLGALSKGVVWRAPAASVVAAGMRCGRCRLQCRLGCCTRRGFVLVPVHVGVCCAGGLPAGRCRLLCVVFPVLCVCAATYRVHAL